MTWSDGIRQVGLESIKAHEPGHLFNQVHLAQEIHPPGRRYNHRPSLFAGGQCTAESRQTGFDLVVRQINGRVRLVRRRQRTQQAMQCIPTQRHDRFRPLLGSTLPAGSDLRSLHLSHQRQSPTGGQQGDLPGQAFLVTGAGVCSLPGGTTAVAHRCGREQCRFQPDALGAVGHTTLSTAHHTRHGHSTIATGHHLHAFVELDFAAIETCEQLMLVGLS